MRRIKWEVLNAESMVKWLMRITWRIKRYVYRIGRVSYTTEYGVWMSRFAPKEPKIEALSSLDAVLIWKLKWDSRKRPRGMREKGRRNFYAAD